MSSRSPRWILPSPKITMIQPSSSTPCTRRVVSIMSVLAGRYGIPKPAHTIRRFRPPTAMSSSLGPNMANLGRDGSVDQHDQRVHPAEMVQAVDGGAGSQVLTTLDANPEQDARREHAEPADETDAGWPVDGAGGQGRRHVPSMVLHRRRFTARPHAAGSAGHPLRVKIRERSHDHVREVLGVTLGRPARARDEGHHHAGRLAGPDAVDRVLHNEAPRRIDTET